MTNNKGIMSHFCTYLYYKCFKEYFYCKVNVNIKYKLLLFR